jgi:hypothetical protein
MTRLPAHAGGVMAPQRRHCRPVISFRTPAEFCNRAPALPFGFLLTKSGLASRHHKLEAIKKDTTMLDDDIKHPTAAYLERVQQPFEMVASLDDSDNSREMLELLQTIQACARQDHPAHRRHDARKPSFTLQRVGS